MTKYLLTVFFDVQSEYELSHYLDVLGVPRQTRILAEKQCAHALPLRTLERRRDAQVFSAVQGMLQVGKPIDLHTIGRCP
jgi:hypothetical protein